MNTSLLAHLYPYFKGSQEDVATSSLNYIVSSNEVNNSTFTNHILTALKIKEEYKLQYECQVSGANNERPDMGGYDVNGNEFVLCESKFFASLTINQPNEYLKRVINNRGRGLIFICPEIRKNGLWNELVQLVNCEFGNVQQIDNYCIEIDNSVRMAITTWISVINDLEKAASKMAPETISDIQQLRGYCEQIDSESFIPFVEEDFSIERAIKEQRYYRILDSLINSLLADKDVDIELRSTRIAPQWAGYRRFFYSGNLGITLEYDTNKWKNSNSMITPFWVKFQKVDNGNWIYDDDCAKAMLTIEPQFKDGEYVALCAPCFASENEIVQSMKNQYKNYRKHFAGI